APQKTIAVLADPVFDKEDSRVSRARGAGRVAARASVPLRFSGDSDLVRSARDTGLTSEGRTRIPRLPFTRREAEALLALAPADQRRAALDFDANREAAADPDLGGYRFVHFATHAWLDTIHPELSGIVLSLVDQEGHEREGFLSASEVFNLHLPV